MYLWLLDDESLINAHHKSKFIREKYPEIYKEFKSITFPEKLPVSQLYWHFINDGFNWNRTTIYTLYINVYNITIFYENEEIS